jgi:hypothetical protein
MIQANRRRQRPVVVVRVCIQFIGGHPILASHCSPFVVPASFSSNRSNGNGLRDAMNYKHSTIPAVRLCLSLCLLSIPVQVLPSPAISHTDDSAFTFTLDPSTFLPCRLLQHYLHPDRTDLGIGIVKEQLGQGGKSTLHSHTRNEND